MITVPPGISDPNAGKRPPGPDELLIYSLIEDRITMIGPASIHELSGDGQFVALAKSGTDGRTSLDVLRLGETKARRVCEFQGEVTALAWGDDHRSLAVVSSKLPAKIKPLWSCSVEAGRCWCHDAIQYHSPRLAGVRRVGHH